MNELPFVRRRLWPLLFPATYLVHIAEEYWGGEGFYRWIARIGGSGLTAERFLALNALAWAVMFVVCAAAVLLPNLRWPGVAFGTVVLLNGAAHVVASFATVTYSPGVVSGALLWIPLGAITLYDSYGRAKLTHFVMAVAVGLALHAIVSVVVFID